jgi:hypothetical protein
MSERERLRIAVSRDTARWLRAEAERDGCSIGHVIETCRLAIEVAHSGGELERTIRVLRAIGRCRSAMLGRDL